MSNESHVGCQCCRRRPFRHYRVGFGNELFSHRNTDHAAIGGQIHILNWAEERGMIGTNRKFVCARAAEGGHLEVLKWARQRDYPWGGPGVMRARKCRYRNSQMGHGKWLLFA